MGIFFAVSYILNLILYKNFLNYGEKKPKGKQKLVKSSNNDNDDLKKCIDRNEAQLKILKKIESLLKYKKENS